MRDLNKILIFYNKFITKIQALTAIYTYLKAAAHEACFNNFLSAWAHSKASQDQAGK